MIKRILLMSKNCIVFKYKTKINFLVLFYETIYVEKDRELKDLKKNYFECFYLGGGPNTLLASSDLK